MKKKVLFWLLAILAMSFAQAEVITSGLVGYWGGENNANDISLLANHGTFVDGNTNTTDNYTAGVYGQAFRLTSDSYVNVGAKSSLVMSSAMTVSFWLRPLSSGAEGMLINKEGEYEVARYGDNSIRWAFANSSPGWAYVNTGISISQNVWSHITITYSSGVVKTYLNGVIAHTYNGSGNIGDAHPTENEFRIGSRQYVCQPNFNGDMDEIALYNRALTAQEVTLLYDGPVIPEPTSFFLLFLTMILYLLIMK